MFQVTVLQATTVTGDLVVQNRDSAQQAFTVMLAQENPSLVAQGHSAQSWGTVKKRTVNHAQKATSVRVGFPYSYIMFILQY